MGKRTVAAWLAGTTIFFCAAPFVPGSVCKDGTSSASIGRRGACSHHGGVNRSDGTWFLLLLLSAMGGFGISRLFGASDEQHIRSDTVNQKLPDPATSFAQKSGYLSPQEYDELQLRMGMSKEQVESQRATASRYATNRD